MSKKNDPTKCSSDKIEIWLKNHSNITFYFLLAVYVIFSLLYFDIKPSIAGDDSSYIIRSINFLVDGKFPTYQGPLYPMFLALIISVTGMNVTILKLSSTLLMVSFIFLFYRLFKNKISYTALFYSIGLLSISNYFLFFSSQTFSEPLFLVLQTTLFYLIFKEINSHDCGWIPSKKEIIKLCFIALTCILLFLTRTIGFGALLTTLVFFLLYKNYRRALYVSLIFVLFLSLFYIVRSNAWDIPLKSGEQTSQLMNKHPYDKTQGKEDFKGFLIRFKDNSNLYLSKQLMRIIGFRDKSDNSVNPIITLILYLIFIYGIYYFYRKNKYLLFTGLYLSVMLGITFFSLQKMWDQYRLIIPFIPLVLLFLTESIIEFLKTKNLLWINRVLPAILLISIILSFNKDRQNIDVATLSKNLNGDKFAGYTPDWVSYLKMAEYCNKNLSETDFVACRKPNIARIYGKGKKFHGIYRIPSDDADELITYLKKRDINYIIMGSLRKNPYVYTGQTINTVKRFMAIIAKKYPKSFKVVKKFGQQEPAYLFQIDFKNPNIENNKN